PHAAGRRAAGRGVLGARRARVRSRVPPAPGRPGRAVAGLASDDRSGGPPCYRARMSFRAWTMLALLMSLPVTLSAPARAASTSIPPANQPLRGPATALESLASAYRGLSAAGIDAVLTGDYRFHGADLSQEGVMRFALGSSREAEMAVVRNMLGGA